MTSQDDFMNKPFKKNKILMCGRGSYSYYNNGLVKHLKETTNETKKRYYN